jgi:hypothetical protein
MPTTPTPRGTHASLVEYDAAGEGRSRARHRGGGRTVEAGRFLATLDVYRPIATSWSGRGSSTSRFAAWRPHRSSKPCRGCEALSDQLILYVPLSKVPRTSSKPKGAIGGGHLVA